MQKIYSKITYLGLPPILASKTTSSGIALKIEIVKATTSLLKY